MKDDCTRVPLLNALSQVTLHWPQTSVRDISHIGHLATQCRHPALLCPEPRAVKLSLFLLCLRELIGVVHSSMCNVMMWLALAIICSLLRLSVLYNCTARPHTATSHSLNKFPLLASQDANFLGLSLLGDNFS